jgi:membrane dipeptidase
MDSRSRAENFHRNSLVVDAHSDYPVHMLLEQQRGITNVFKTEHLPKLRATGIRVETVTIGGDFELGSLDLRNPFVTLAILDCVHQQLKDCADNVILIQSAADLEAVRNSQRIGLLFALEGAAPIAPDLSLVRTYYRLGVRSILLTHNERNLFADGCAESPRGGLSKLGKQLVREMNQLHMVLDLSHSSEGTFHDALEVFAGTPIASHSNARRLCDHVRNLTDEQIKAIASRGGVIGANFLAGFVDKDTAKATPKRLVEHMAYIADLVGSEHVGIGPDYADYYMEKLLSWATDRNLPAMKFTKDLESVTQLPLLTEALVEHGFSDADIRGILGENFLRAYAANLSLPEQKATGA